MKPTALLLVPALLAGLAAPALAEAPAQPEMERVQPNFFGLLGYNRVGPGLFGLPTSTAKDFRLAGDNSTVFRGLGRDNDVLDFFFPSYDVRWNLRRRLKPVPAALAELDLYEQSIRTSNAVSLAGNALGWGGLGLVGVGGALGIASSKNGSIAGTLILTGLGSWAIGYVSEHYVSPILFYSSFYHLDQSVEQYNKVAARKASP